MDHWFFLRLLITALITAGFALGVADFSTGRSRARHAVLVVGVFAGVTAVLAAIGFVWTVGR